MNAISQVHDYQDGISGPLFLSPEQRGSILVSPNEVVMTVGEMVSLTRLLGGMGLSDFQRVGCNRQDIERLVDLHTDLHFALTEEFGSRIVSAELS